MPRITRDSLLTLEAYAKSRSEFRARVLAHKKLRTVHLGEHLTLLFEDELTIRYQIQEMLRVEKTFEEAGIRDELDAYNPLIPDGSNWKATLLIEYEDVESATRGTGSAQGHRGPRLGAGRRAARASTRSPTRISSARTRPRPHRCISCASSSTPDMIAALKHGAALAIGADHPAYTCNALAGPRAHPRVAACRDLARADRQG